MQFNNQETVPPTINLDPTPIKNQQITQVYRTLDGKANEPIPFYLKGIVDSWPGIFNDPELKQLNCGNTSIKFEFYEQKLVFSLEVKDGTTTHPTIASCQFLHRTFSCIDGQTKVSLLLHQPIKSDYGNDFLYVMITSLKAIEVFMHEDPDGKTRKRNKFMPYCYVSIGSYIRVKINYPGIVEHYKLGNSNLHYINCGNDLLISLLNIAKTDLINFPFQNHNYSYFIQPCIPNVPQKQGGSIIGKNPYYCLLKLESNGLKIMMRAILLITTWDPCDGHN